MRPDRSLPFAVASNLAFALLAASILSAQGAIEVLQHAPADGSATYWAFRHALPAAAGDVRALPVQADGQQLGFFVAESPAADGTVVWICRARRAPAAEIRLEGSAGRVASLSVDWAMAKDEPGLAGRWQRAVRDHFRRLDDADILESFSELVSSRLAPATPERAGLQDPAARRRRQAAVLDLIAGRTAIEESLQLDRLRGVGRDATQPANVPLSSIEGVTIASHPWEEMLKGRRPEPHPIERFLPLDQYALEAGSLSSFLEVLELTDGLLGPALHLAEGAARDDQVRLRLERQLCLPVSALARTLGSLVIGRVALTGGDPYLREGSDVTLVFELKSAEAFLANLEAQRLAALQSLPGAKRSESEHAGHAIVSVASPWRIVSSHATVVDGYALISNSLEALRRVLDAARGELESQDDGLDRRYVRTLLPSSADESAFLFLSDSFIRKLVGPGLRLRESRRLECSASLRSVAHAAAWRRVRGEVPAASLRLLTAEGDLPAALLLCPDGGSYELLAGGDQGSCSVHGTLEFLTPNAELPLAMVTAEESSAYADFRERYQRYWSRYFDPIGMRFRLSDSAQAVETVVLPLIQLSEYREWSDLFGGQDRQKGPMSEAVAGMSLLVSAHLNRESELFRNAETMARGFLFQGAAQSVLGWVGDRVSLFIEDAPAGFRGADLDDPVSGMLGMLGQGLGGGVRVAIKNQLLLAGFLGAVKGLIVSAAPGSVEFETLPERKGISLVKVASKEGSGGSGPEAVYYGIIGDGLYLSLRREALEAVVDRHAGSAAPAAVEPPPPQSSWIDGSHIALQLDWAGSPRWKALFTELYAREASRLCERGRRTLRELAALGLQNDAGRRALDGAIPCCPLGGGLRLDAAGGPGCSAHVEGAAPQPTTPLDRWRQVRARLEFTPEGLRAALEGL